MNNLLGTGDAIFPNKWGLQHLEDGASADTPRTVAAHRGPLLRGAQQDGEFNQPTGAVQESGVKPKCAST